MPLWLRALEKIHGHTGWLAAAALLHPAILLRRRERKARLSVVLAPATLTVAAVLGLQLYSPYRLQLKQRLFVEAPTIGWLFERKEHLAVAALSFAWFGCIAHLSAWHVERPTRDRLAGLAHHAFVVATVLSVVVAVIGVTVAVRAPF
jgi:hypothetical protein